MAWWGGGGGRFLLTSILTPIQILMSLFGFGFGFRSIFGTGSEVGSGSGSDFDSVFSFGFDSLNFYTPILSFIPWYAFPPLFRFLCVVL